MGLHLHHVDSLELGSEAGALLFVLVLLIKRFWLALSDTDDRYSVVYKGECLGHTDMRVAVKLYEKPSLVPKKQKMATREAIVLKYLNSQG